jgi:hypothetical protein
MKRLAVTVLGLGLGASLLAAPAVAQNNPWLHAPGSKEFPNAAGIILKDDIQAVVHPDGTQDLIEYDAIKILDKNGVDRFQKTQRFYDFRSETAEVTLARLYAADGSVSDVPRAQITDIVPDEFNQPLYQRMHELSIDYGPKAVEGAVVEFRIVHHRRVPWPDNRYWEISYTQDFEPILDTQFTFTSPATQKFETAAVGMPNVQAEVTRSEGNVTLHWHMTDRPALARETAMPPLRQLATQVQVSNFQNWQDLATWARRLYEGAAQPDSAVTARAAKICAGSVGTTERVRALMTWLDKEKKLVPGDLSLEEMPPHTAAECLSSPGLMPTDRAVLLLAMLKALSIKAYPVLLATSEYGTPDRGLPSLQQFNRLLLVIAPEGQDRRWTWIDPNAAVPGVLGQGIMGQQAMVLNDEPARLVRAPLSSPEANREEIAGISRLDPDGSAETELKVREFGSNDVVWRSMMNSAKTAEQRRVFELLVQEINPTAELRDFYVTPGDSGPFQLTLSFDERRAVGRTQDTVSMPMPLLAQKRLASYAETPVAQRRYPVSLGGTAYEERRLEIVIPTGWSVKKLPQSVHLDNEVGSYQVESRSEGRSVFYYSRLILRRPEVPVAQYPAFKALMDALAASSEDVLGLTAPPTPAHVPKVK